ncbi:hypothetical protein CAPTEDRAFT_187477 [Capitella teleta]|uniref:Uncharacterized protein n=1 Tax=Capitella teleta TaxID=283909 RepID=R7VKF8_CAPTE|nr:hypothetical protein CAPTEDRAFT_187477 [Capitella teleta]|eukprot:ELU17336.1 hypothetical protein CAPTEDRAFT_187477 [Capitella teleta]
MECKIYEYCNIAMKLSYTGPIRKKALGQAQFNVPSAWIIWMVIVLSALGGLVYYVADRVNVYLRYDTNINVIVNYIDDMDFPAVTICNQNAFKLTKAVYGGWYHEVISMVNHTKRPPDDECLATEYRCKNGECIPWSTVCDMFPDCSDDSDEIDCDICQRIRITTVSVSSISGVFHITDGLPAKYAEDEAVYLSTELRSERFALMSVAINSTWSQWRVVVYDTGNIQRTIAKSEHLQKNGRFAKQMRWNIYYANGTAKAADDITLTCDVKRVEQPDVQTLSLSKDKQYENLRHLYELGSHGKEEFFLLDKYITSFFNFTINVEQYEYIYEPREGAGIQMLLHDARDPPVMQGQSLSISPGLFSLISLERAQVVGLGPPWGNCSEQILEYYEKYGVNTCIMNCENKVLRKGCDCVDVYLASTDRGNSFKMKRGCSCKQPCIQDIYVPTLSFSSLSFDKDKLSRTDTLRMAQLASTLSDAREIVYRIQENHYRNTMRVFEGIFLHAWTSLNALQAVEDLLLEEMAKIKMLTSQVKTDCLKFQRFFASGIRVMRKAMRQEILTLEDHLLYNISSGLQRLAVEVVRVAGTWNEMRRNVEESNTKLLDLYPSYTPTTDSYETTNAYETTTFGNSTAGYNITEAPFPAYILQCGCPIPEPVNLTEQDRNGLGIHLKPLYDQIVADVQLTAFELLKSVVDATLRLNESESLSIVLQKDKIEWLIPYLRVVCEWCLTEMETQLSTILRDRLLYSILDNRDTSNLLEQCEHSNADSVNNIASYLCSLHAAVISLDETGFMSNATFIDIHDDNDMEAFFLAERIRNLSSGIPNIAKGLHHSITKDLETAADMTQELLEEITPLCAGSFEKPFEDYANVHFRTEWTLSEIKSALLKYSDHYTNYQNAYRDGVPDITLRNPYLVSSFDVEVIFMQGKYINIESLLQDRMIALNRTGNHINRLYIWFMVLIPDHILANKSSLWRHFGVKSPGFSHPAVDYLANDHTPLDPGVAMKSPEIDRFWNAILDKITLMQTDILATINQLLDNMRESRKYFKNYADGNNVDESFYKKNFVQLDVFYKELTERAVVTQKAFEYPALLGEIGGLMGLILGASAITLIEFIDMIIYAIYTQMLGKIERSKKKARYGIGACVN